MCHARIWAFRRCPHAGSCSSINRLSAVCAAQDDIATKKIRRFARGERYMRGATVEDRAARARTCERPDLYLNPNAYRA